MKRCLVCLLTLSLTTTAVAQSAPTSLPTSQPASQPAAPDDDDVEEVEVTPGPAGQDRSLWWGLGYPQIDRGVNLALPSPVRRGALVLVVDHRTTQPIQDNTWHDYFGLDAGGLKIGLGLRVGVLEGLDAGVYRLSSGADRFDVYQFDARYQLLRQQRHHLDLALRGGVTWFSQQDAEDAVGGLGQLLLARRFFERLTLATGLLFHSDSTNGVKSTEDENWSLAAMVLLDLRIFAWLAWTAEVGVNVAGYGSRDKKDAAGESHGSWPCFSSSVRFITSRHTFSLVLSNDPYTSGDGGIANTTRGFDKLIVGFTITREWNLWD